MKFRTKFLVAAASVLNLILSFVGCGGSSMGNPPPPQSNRLTVSLAGSGNGIVTSSPAGVNCGDNCVASFGSGATVQLTAGPSQSSTFAGWSGACSGTGSCQVTMNSAQSVTATFNIIAFTLSVNSSGSGSGIVTSSPAGINCGATCSASFSSGTAVQLTAIANQGST